MKIFPMTCWATSCHGRTVAARQSTNTYNGFGQLTNKNYPDTVGVIDYQYTYDVAGNLSSATDPSGTTTLDYDPVE